MKVNESNIETLIGRSKTAFMIPVYQRNYSWKEEHIKAYYDTIVFLARPENQDTTHFIGTICYKEMAEDEFSIIDGQQRITTTMLLIKAMHDTAKDKKLQEKLENYYLYNTEDDIPTSHHVKLHLNTADDRIYNILLENDRAGIDKAIDDQDARSRIYQNYKWFYDRLSTASDEKIKSLWYALERIVLIELDVEYEDPQEIFESLNSTGLELTDVDKLRNYMLMDMDRPTQERLYNDYWYKIEQNVLGDEFIVDFFCDWLIYTKRSDSVSINGRSGHINQNTLYHSYKDFYNKRRENGEKEQDITFNILENMLDISQTYHRLVYNNPIDISSVNDETAILYALTSINEAEKLRPLLLHIILCYDQKLITRAMELKLLRICNTWVMRAKICGFTSIGYQSAAIVLKRFIDNCTVEDKIDYTSAETNLWKALSKLEGRDAVPNDGEFKSSLLNDDLYRSLHSSKTKYLLYQLELNAKDRKSKLPGYTNETISIEHIMPQTLNDDWEAELGEDYDEAENYITKLGNLTLTEFNSEESNKTFSAKKQYYQHDGFYYTRLLVKEKEWNNSSIKQRTKALAAEAMRIWKVPTEYQHENTIDFGRAEAFRFDMVGIKPGEKVIYVNNPCVIATVIDEKHIEWNGQEYSLSGLAKKLDDITVSGPSVFTYKGEKLTDMRNRMEKTSQKKRKTKLFKFSDAGLKPGDVIISCENPMLEVKIVDDMTVLYYGEQMSLYALARKIEDETYREIPDNKIAEHFKHDDMKLSQLVKKMKQQKK